MKCKYCGSRKVIKKGFKKNLTGKVREHLGIKKVPPEVLGMKRLSSRKLIVKIFLFLVLQSVLVVRR